MVLSILGCLGVLVLCAILGSDASAATDAVVAEEPAVDLVWFLAGGVIAAVFIGGGFAELLKKSLLARWKERAALEHEEKKRVAEESGFLSKVRKPWWWVALLGVVATVTGCVAMVIAAPLLGYHVALGALVGAGGGVNATWLWNPIKKALKGIISAVKGRFVASGEQDQ